MRGRAVVLAVVVLVSQIAGCHASRRLNLAVLRPGNPRTAVEEELGTATSLHISADGLTTATYEYDPQFQVDWLQLLSNLALGLQSGNAASIVGGSIGCVNERRRELLVVYGADGRLLSVQRREEGRDEREPDP